MKAQVLATPAVANETSVVQKKSKPTSKVISKAQKAAKSEKRHIKEEAEDKLLDPKAVKDLLAKNDKLWQDKMGNALTTFK